MSVPLKKKFQEQSDRDPFLDYRDYTCGVDPDSTDVFQKFHLALSKKRYLEHQSSYKNLIEHPTHNLDVLRIQPQLGDFLYLLQRVGGGKLSYAWDRRKKYHPKNSLAVQDMLDREGTTMNLFCVDGKLAGFCLTRKIDKPPRKKKSETEQGIHKYEALKIFAQMSQISIPQNPIEIFKIGLFPEYTGQGALGRGNHFGPYFLGHTFHDLFSAGYDTTYLDTRDWNFPDVLKFYDQNHVPIFYVETLPNDLFPKEELLEWRPYSQVIKTLLEKETTPSRLYKNNFSSLLTPHPLSTLSPPSLKEKINKPLTGLSPLTL